MATLHEQILARLLVIASAVPGVLLAERSRRTGVDRDQTPAILIRPDQEDDERFGDLADRHQLGVQLIVMTRGEPWDTVADPIVDALHKAVMKDTALKALSLDVRRAAREPEDTNADATAGQYTLRYRVTYLTRADDLSASL
jgi:hypothetical protein